ncbi:transcriptional regulator with XRE-family HTH domain [Cytobacillus eiseniae]|uniref:Transcriptional regulator with XRE-family HTH domain n=1 Tax=Cytobacillus eiseniae TaxID=762947 RepID=A0ABS4RHS7_9BACI|nr:helix-turn-helix domain-containing protein [Cytobacillus eiseniae]MBP2242455.1 transcriptional regulator with XRE-family HTH domain [Cytobacillus eiseniae]
MYENLIGVELKKLRLEKGITQAQLCEGICHQSMLSKIEKGETYPSAPILYKLSQKLHVDMEYFFVHAHMENYEYVKETFNTIRQAVQKKDYLTVKELVLLEEKNPTFNRFDELKQFLLWHKGIALYYVDNDPSAAIEILNLALKLNNSLPENINLYSEREFEIVNTLAVIYSEINKHETAFNYFNEAKKILTSKQLKDERILIRVNYNMTKVLTRLCRHEESIELCNDGINECIQMNSMYLYGELTYQLGYNYELMNHKEIAVDFYKKSLEIFSIKANHRFNEYIQKRISNLTIVN